MNKGATVFVQLPSEGERWPSECACASQVRARSGSHWHERDFDDRL